MTNYDTGSCKSVTITVYVQLAYEIRKFSCLNLLLIKYCLTFNREFIKKNNKTISIFFYIFWRNSTLTEYIVLFLYETSNFNMISFHMFKKILSFLHKF